jgi:hypothetical protein
MRHGQRRGSAYVVTEARPGMSEDIARRQRRYLIMMGIRTVLFITAVLFFVNHLGWLTAFPAVGAIVIPYFAVVLANGGREPTARRGFRAYEPNLPARFEPHNQESSSTIYGTAEPTQGNSSGSVDSRSDPGTPGGSGAPPHNG